MANRIPYEMPIWARTDYDLIMLFEPMATDDPSFEAMHRELLSRGLTEVRQLSSDGPNCPIKTDAD